MHIYLRLPTGSRALTVIIVGVWRTDRRFTVGTSSRTFAGGDLATTRRTGA